MTKRCGQILVAGARMVYCTLPKGHRRPCEPGKVRKVYKCEPWKGEK